MSRNFAALTLAIALSVAPCPRVAAQDPYGCVDDLSDEAISYRLRWVEARLASTKRWARMHWYGWLLFAAGASAFSWIMYATADDQPKRTANLISGVGSILLAGQIAAFPSTAVYMPQRLARLPRGTAEERREALRYATHALERTADRQLQALELWPQALPLAWAAWSGTYLSVRFHGESGTPAYASMAFLLPNVLVTLRYATQPRSAVDDWGLYVGWACSGAGLPIPPERASSDVVSAADVGHTPPAAPSNPPRVFAGPGSMGLAISF